MTTVPLTRSKLGTANTGVRDIQVNVPTDSSAPVVGDLMFVQINTTAATPVITPPSAGSWVQILAPVAMGSRYMALYRGIRGASDPTQYIFTQNNTGAAQSLFVALPGIYGGVGSYSKGASAVTQTTPGVTTTVANSLALSFQAEATANTEVDSDITVASPFVKDLWTIAPSSPINSILLAHRDMATPGATGDAVSTWKTGNSTGNRGSIMVIVEPLPDATPDRLAVKMSDGAGSVVDAGLVWWDGQNEIQLSKLEAIYPGTPVSELFSTSRVWWMAHRGGSADYQEHSERGYLESARCHADVFEASLVMSSDGVIFLAHDNTANRTSSSVGPSAANGGTDWFFNQHTAAEIEALIQDLPGRGDTRFNTAPYMRLTQLVSRWAKTHTLMLDTKYINTAGRQALYAYIQTIPNYRECIMGKFYHSGTTIADEFHAIGCKVWGYGYTADVNDGSYAQTAAKWDLLGLEYTASQNTWNALKSIAGSKKILGHIVPTAQAAQDAVALGAKALQVSGVNSVSTVY